MPPGLRGSDPAVGLENQGAGVFRYWPLRWVQQSETGGTIAEFLAAHSLNDGSVLWSRPYDERLLGPSTGASSAQGVDGVLYVASMDYSGNIPGYQGPRLTKAGRLAAVSPRDGSILWHTWMPVPDGFTSASLTGIVGGPVASRKHRGVYVASLNCKVYFFDGEGQIRWWYRLDGQPLGQLPQLVDGILYVLTYVPHGVPEDQEVCCGSPDVYRARYRYDCDHTLFDQPCIQGWWGGVYQLYAFRAE